MPEESGSMYEPATPPAEADKPDVQEDADGGTALLPKSILVGKEPKVGDTHKFEIVHIYSDEIEVRCKGQDEKKEPAESEPSMGAKIDKMGMMNG
jgi:hypothetical protein